MEHSTIAAIATAPGAGGIAVVRLSGPESYAVAAKVFHPANPAKRVEEAKGYTALFGHFMEGEEAFDEGVADVEAVSEKIKAGELTVERNIQK